ncbi:MAG: hypothetical protein JXD18_14730 [Anaerolineae bacterium]|nr:hypothetical protein [Anaerolineae bacterium]
MNALFLTVKYVQLLVVEMCVIGAMMGIGILGAVELVKAKVSEAHRTDQVSLHRV